MVALKWYGAVFGAPSLSNADMSYMGFWSADGASSVSSHRDNVREEFGAVWRPGSGACACPSSRRYQAFLTVSPKILQTITLLLEAVPFEHQDGSHITQGSVRVESAFGRWLRTCGFGDDVYAAVVPWLKRSGVGVGGDLDTVLSFVWAEGRDDWNLSPDARLKLEFALAEYFRSNEGVAQSSPQ
jgi:hypothetical protein